MVSIFAGQIFDLGHLRNLLCGGSALIVAGMFLLSASSQYYQIFLTQAILVGSGYGCLYLLGPAVISQYFRKRTALAMGVSSIGAAVGTSFVHTFPWLPITYKLQAHIMPIILLKICFTHSQDITCSSETHNRYVTNTCHNRRSHLPNHVFQITRIDRLWMGHTNPGLHCPNCIAAANSSHEIQVTAKTKTQSNRSNVIPGLALSSHESRPLPGLYGRVHCLLLY